MKLSSVSIGLVACVLGMSATMPLAASSSNNAPVAVVVQTVTVTSNGSMKITVGSDFGDVFFAMKYKNRETLASNVWVFSDFHADPDSDALRGCRYLVVTFADKRVVSLRLANQPALTAIAADLRLGSQVRNFASRRRLDEPGIESLLIVGKRVQRAVG
jgi:hypothetical protein